MVLYHHDPRRQIKRPPHSSHPVALRGRQCKPHKRDRTESQVAVTWSPLEYFRQFGLLGIILFACEEQLKELEQISKLSLEHKQLIYVISPCATTWNAIKWLFPKPDWHHLIHININTPSC